MQKIFWPVTLIGLISIAAQAQSPPPGNMSAPKGPVYVSQARDSTELAGEIPCSMVQRLPNGSWWIKGTVIMSGMTMSDMAFGGGPESQVFESRCGKGQSK
jgi:hypothetical protein